MMYQLSGVGPESHLGVFNNDISTMQAALLERMYFCKVQGVFEEPPQVELSFIFDTLCAFKSALLRRMGRSTPLTTDEVVETYRGRKRTIYENANIELQRTGLKRRHAHSIMFVKAEKAKTGGVPRAIQPRAPVYNLSLGRYTKAIEHRIYGAIAKIFCDGPTVMKGYDVTQVARIARGKWDSYHDPVAVGLDATKFDMHVCASMLRWEHTVYEEIFSGDPELRKLLSWQMHNIGRGYAEDGKLKYTVKGRRFSGDMNTGLGNCLIMCAMVWTYLKTKQVRGSLMNNGDDCVVFIERADLSTFQEGLDAWFLKLGFRMVSEDPVYDFQRIEFCQMRPVRGRHGWTMVRNIRTALIKDTLTSLNISSQGAMLKWMHAVGECGLALTSGVPIMQSFYDAYIRLGTPNSKISSHSYFANSGMRMMRGDLTSMRSPISSESRLDVYVAWGITPDEQVAIEQFYDQLAGVNPYDCSLPLASPPLFNVL